RTQAEMAHTCRGTINLSTAHIDTEDSCNIVLSNGGRTYHLKANSEVERQRWVTALELAKAKAIRMRNNQSDDSGDEEPASQSDKGELHGTLKTLSSKLEDLSTCNELIALQCYDQRMRPPESLLQLGEGQQRDLAQGRRAVVRRAFGFLPLLQACRDFLDLAETHSRKWQRALQYEREQRIRLEETIEQLAKQHNSLERACRGAPGLASGGAGIANAAKDMLLLAREMFAVRRDVLSTCPCQAEGGLEGLPSMAGLSRSGSSNQTSYNESTCKDLLPKKRRRTRIPDKPNYSLNLWSIMKNCIGKELSKIPMP
ncbi:Oxysterol-binding protein 1, partial [Tinamus guttatus]